MRLPQRLYLRPGAVPNRTYRSWGLPIFKSNQPFFEKKLDFYSQLCIINS